MTRSPSVRRGFTLIELMIVVAIIGILSSIAIPNLSRAQVRARVTERATVMEAMARAINDTVSANQRFPDPASPNVWDGPANPPGIPGTSKRGFNYGLGGWQYMPIVVQGSCYYQYNFHATPTTMTTWADGDLDGDGALAHKTFNYTSKGFIYIYASEVPPPGAEDDVTYGTF